MYKLHNFVYSTLMSKLNDSSKVILLLRYGFIYFYNVIVDTWRQMKDEYTTFVSVGTLSALEILKGIYHFQMGYLFLK